jgi:hypothetical protein
MRGQGDLDLIPNIAPFGMMIALLGQQCDLGHEAKSRAEVLEFKGLDDSITPLRQAPARQSCQSSIATFTLKLFHGFFLPSLLHRQITV